mmetsp:Transcript_58866/g.140425  ORF Transcript_58866/g.140425 Transcript_58866/m.140425 type:complete len:206 (-) Transcript_58866:7-624(-)
MDPNRPSEDTICSPLYSKLSAIKSGLAEPVPKASARSDARAGAVSLLMSSSLLLTKAASASGTVTTKHIVHVNCDVRLAWTSGSVDMPSGNPIKQSTRSGPTVSTATDWTTAVLQAARTSGVVTPLTPKETSAPTMLMTGGLMVLPALVEVPTTIGGASTVSAEKNRKHIRKAILRHSWPKPLGPYLRVCLPLSLIALVHNCINA